MKTAPATLPDLRVDSLELPSLSAFVGAYFAVRLCLTFLFFQSNPQLGTVVSLSLNLGLLLSVTFYSFNPAQPLVQVRAGSRCVAFVAAFLGVSFLSLLWSEAVSIPVALTYWAAMAADVLMVALLIGKQSREEAMLDLLRGYVLGACFIAVVMWCSPTMGDLRPGNDEFFSPNAIGFTCAFGIFLAQILMLHAQGGKHSRVWRIAAFFLAVSLLRSLSKTTIVAVLASQTLLLFTNPTIRRRSKVLVIAAAALVLVAFSGLISAYYEVYTNAGNQAETLTGRVGIWAFILDRSLERPWLGHGFNSVWKVIPPFGPDRFEAWHAHNELLQQFYTYGIVGVILVALLYAAFYRQLRSLPQAGYKVLFRSLLVFILIRGLGDTERFDLSFPLWSIVLLSGIMKGLSQSHRHEVLR